MSTTIAIILLLAWLATGFFSKIIADIVLDDRTNWEVDIQDLLGTILGPITTALGLAALLSSHSSIAPIGNFFRRLLGKS